QFLCLFPGRKLILFAHSMAGRVVLLAHENHDVLPDLLIMADTPLTRHPRHFKPEPPFVNKKYPDKEHMLRRFRLMPPGTSANPELLMHIAEHAIRQNEDGTWSWKFSDEGTSRPVGLKMPDFNEMRMETMTCPTLVIYGEHSALVGADEARAIAQRFPRARLVSIPGAYHHLMLDRPKAFNDALLEFLRENAACL
ncbi:alpha/beta hydrolase, partial [Candidatus Sumerlaeota bacterium]|nr:alpha/beta hydrolase [Candidatus Sumerlaeota bacterium]